MRRVVLTALTVCCCQFLAAAAAPGQPVAEPRLRVLTVNAWSGLDYEGLLRFGEYESAERRDRRFGILVAQLEALDPDVVFVQEANVAGRYASRLARALGLSEIHQVVNGGIKLGPVGLPTNLKEGLAILARPALQLRKHDAWKLSGPPGLYGNLLTVHFSEAEFALVGKVLVGDTPLYLVNVHLTSSPLVDEAAVQRLRQLPTGGTMSDAEVADAVARAGARTVRRAREVGKLRAFAKRLPKDSPVIIAGDFNADPGSSEIREFAAASGVLDTLAVMAQRNPADRPRPFTWDPARNGNVAYSTKTANAAGRERNALGRLDSVTQTDGRRIDYVFLGPGFGPQDVSSSSIVLDSGDAGGQASDHFGVMADLDMTRVRQTAPRELATVVVPARTSIEALPIAMYDTDIGFGYGAKAFVLNALRTSESFDLTVFNSTKGERWYRFVFSMPDSATRQGKVYPLAVDLSVDYDKLVKNSYFGVGHQSQFADREFYTREPLDINLTFSRGLTSRTVGQLGVRYVTVRNFNFADDSRLRGQAPPANAARATSVSFVGAARYDSRDSFLHPSEGVVIQADGELAPKVGMSNVSFGRLGAWLQYYTVLFYPRTILAVRVGGQSLCGKDLPVQTLLSLGGNRTLRGSPQDRYLDRATVLTNAELRFPIVGKLGGVVGMDAGKVWPSLGDVEFSRWAANPVFGLRYYLKTFVVRVDVGLGKDTTGVYFNFGHLF